MFVMEIWTDLGFVLFLYTVSWKKENVNASTDFRFRLSTGTYYFGQPMQAEDFVEINRGVKRTELSDAGYRGEYDWGDLLYCFLKIVAVWSCMPTVGFHIIDDLAKFKKKKVQDRPE